MTLTLQEYKELKEEYKEFFSGSGNNNTSQLNKDVLEALYKDLGHLEVI